MTDSDNEKLIDELNEALTQNADLSHWKKNHKISPLLTLIGHLKNMPKSPVPQINLSNVRSRILDKISVPALVEPQSSWFMSALPRMLKLGIVGIGSFLIVISLGLGTAVAALQSVPGQMIYPLKKIVESVELKLASEEQKPALQLRFAQARVDELEQLINQYQDGEISDEDAEKIVSETVRDLQKNTDAAAVTDEPKLLNKLVDLSDQLKNASIQTEGQIKIELEKAVEATIISQEEAIKNIENAGLQIDTQPISIPDLVTTSGRLTEVSDTSINIGTAAFFFSEDTQYEGIDSASDLEIGDKVEIEGLVKDEKTFILIITKIDEPEPSSENTEEPTSSNDNL